LTKEDPKIEDLARFLFKYQSAEGFFKLSPKGPGWWSCFTATVLGALLRFGYINDDRVAKGIEWLFRTQRLDGGWYCTKNALKGVQKKSLKAVLMRF
jgi:prenyltransferase beta subunit